MQRFILCYDEKNKCDYLGDPDTNAPIAHDLDTDFRLGDEVDAEIARMTQQLATVLLREQRRVNELEARERELRDGIIEALKMLHPTPTSFVEPNVIERLRHALHGIPTLSSSETVEQNTGDRAP